MRDSGSNLAIASPLFKRLSGVGMAWWAVTQFIGRISEQIVSSVTGFAKNYTVYNGVIPDFIDRASNIMIEVKAVGELSFTQQLRSMLDYAQAKNYQFQIWVTQSTQLSPTIQQLRDNGTIIINTIPGLP